MKPLKVFLCDLTHDTVVLVSDTIPINVGFIGAYAQKKHGRTVDVSLLKYPGSAIDAIADDPPDVLALSNYSWNSNLSERVAGLAKERNPSVVTVQGGTNFPHEAALQLDFMLARPNTDVFVQLEGEVAFSELLGRVLSARDGGPGTLDGAIPGCVYIAPGTRLCGDPVLLRGEMPPRIRELDTIPSPYLNGMLDHFFDGRLTPFLETNRGCPFTCTFCHTGNDYFRKTHMFSTERVIEEINYIAPRVAALGIVNLHIADTNFAMYPRDQDICRALVDARKRHGWPRHIMATTGKNNKERVIDITEIMGNAFAVNMSVQSMDEQVLANIKRSNIRLEDYVRVNSHLQARGRATKGELIIGLPGESRESFVRGLRRILDANVATVTIYTLMLLHGTAFKNPGYRKEFGIEGRFRVVPLNYGEYGGERVFDVEEAGIATRDMPFEDYLWLRELSLLVETLYNSRPFEEFFQYAAQLGLSRLDFMLRIRAALERAPAEIREIMDGFKNETSGELWDSEAALIAHYREDANYEKLTRGEVGGNLIYKYKAKSIAFSAPAWIAFLRDVLEELAGERSDGSEAHEAALREIAVLAGFVGNKLAGLLDIEGDLERREMRSPYDILGWLRADPGARLADFKRDEPVRYSFAYSEGQLEERADLLQRYGSDAAGLSKIVTRVSEVQQLFRRVSSDLDDTGEEVIADTDQFVRYALSN